MSDIKEKLKHIQSDKKQEYKFLNLLHSNAQFQSIKDREVVPTVSIGAWGNGALLPSIHQEKVQLGKRSFSDKKLTPSFPSHKMITPTKPVSRNRVCSSEGKINGSTQKRTKITSISSIKNLMLHKVEEAGMIVQGKQERIDRDKKKVVRKQILEELSREGTADSIYLNVKSNRIQQTPSLKLYLSHKFPIPPSPIQIIGQMRKFIQKYSIQNALIQTMNLHSIFCQKVAPANYRILKEFINHEELIKQYQEKMPGLKFYTNTKRDRGRHLAALKIQGLFRGIVERKYAKRLASLVRKVRIVQKWWKIALQTKRTRQKILTHITHKYSITQNLQLQFINSWPLVQTYTKIEVHISSQSLTLFQHLTTPNPEIHEIRQIVRIFHIAQADTAIVYVSPVQINREVLKYYERILGYEVDSVQKKLRIVTVQGVMRQKGCTVSTVSEILYCNKTLKKLKRTIKQVQQDTALPTTTYIVPSSPSTQYVNLSYELNIPIFGGPSQHILKHHSTKSGFRLLFDSEPSNKGCKSLQLLKCVHSIYSSKQLYNTLAILIHKNPEVLRWYLKIEDEIEGRGLAIVKVGSFGLLRELRKTDIQMEEENVLKVIAEQLRQNLHKRLKIINKSVYPHANAYLQTFLTHGGLIEAAPSNATTEHSLSFLIKPNGDFSILGTYSRISHNGATLDCGVIVPSLVNLEEEKIQYQAIMRQMYRKLYLKKKLWGYFSIDMLWDSRAQRNYILGIDCFLNTKTCSMFIPQLSCHASYNKQTNKLEQNLHLSQSLISQFSSNIPEIYYFYYPHISLDNLPNMTNFFKQCKFSNIAFDLQTKTGTIFLILNQIQNGEVGLFISARKKDKLFQETKHVIQFLDNLTKNKQNRNKQIGLLRGIMINYVKKYTQKVHHQEDYNISSLF